MAKSSFIDTHFQRDAFLGNLLERLVELIVHQGNDLLAAAGIKVPARAVSTVLLVAERSGITAADIGKELSQPHQLVTQRIELLLKLGILEREIDPLDGRRKVLVLSAEGHCQVKLLRQCLGNANDALIGLQQEIACDLSTATLNAIHALEKRPILDRAAIHTSQNV